MKKLLFLFFAVMALLPVRAESFSYEGLKYNITSEMTVEVGQNDKVSGDIKIPATVEYASRTYSVTSIGNNAFFRCSGLTSVEIPNSVTRIGNWAFYYCSSLTSVTIPNSVTSIGASVFSGCSGLTCIEVDINNLRFSSYQGILYTKNMDKLIRCPEGKNGIVEIPNSVTSIEVNAFLSCSGLTSVKIPNSVITIGGGAFNWCTSLTNVEIGNSVTEIGNGAFSECPIETLSINCKTIGRQWFSGFKTLRNLKIGDSVEYIGYFAFKDCGLRGTLIIPNSVTSIGYAAFEGCWALTGVVIGNSVGYIGELAFEGCHSLDSVEIPNSVTEIGEKAFYNCNYLKSLYIGEKVEKIGASAFASSKLLEEIAVASEHPQPASMTIFSDFTYTYATLFVPESAMHYCEVYVPWKLFSKYKKLDEYKGGNGNENAVENVYDEPNRPFDVYNLHGVCVKRQASQSDIDALSPGIYIVNGEKIVVQ